MRVLPVPREWERTLRIVTEVSDHDYETFLTEDEQRRLHSFKRERRRAEWSASRIAAKLLAVDLELCSEPRQCAIVSSYRKPSLSIPGAGHGWHVSISHSSGAGAAALDRRPIGIDIQQLRDLNPRATKFYLKDDELAQLQSCGVEHPLIHFWCAKEAAYKLRAGRGWLKRVSISMVDDSTESLRFALSYPVEGDVHTFRVHPGYIAAVARQLKP